MTLQLPWLTRSLRTFSQLDRPDLDATSQSHNLEEFRKWKAKQTKNERSWGDLQSIMEVDANPHSNVKKLLHDLRQLAQEMSGGDQSPGVVDEATKYLLQLFLDDALVSQKHMQALKLRFGSVSPNLANKVCIIIVEIRSALSEECIEKLMGRSDSITENRQCFGKDIKFVFRRGQGKLPDTRHLADLTVDLATGGGKVVREFSMKYDESLAGVSSRDDIGVKTGTTKKNGYGKTWLQKELQAQYKNSNPSGLSMEEFTETLINKLKSSRSNDELQNELFDLMGFDCFELIQLLLTHRADIICSTSVAEEKKVIASSSGSQLPLQDRRPNFGCQVVVQSEQEKLLLKMVRKEEKKISKVMLRDGGEEEEPEFNPLELRAKRQVALKSVMNEPIFRDTVQRKVQKQEHYPYVFDSQKEAQQMSGFISGVKMSLPINLERTDNKLYEEVYIPIPNQETLTVGSNFVQISSLDEIGQMAFQGVKALNRIQTIVFNTAYHTNENLLICAPTGAGKTNVALLTIVNTIRQFIDQNVIKRDQFKIVYVAPMKALAAEMTSNFNKKLGCLGISVRELTGDMQLTKTEILQTQMLVTTPEKWDVVTRKGTGDVALTNLVKLLIIDEVHLLHGDRGPVVEALVARTLRLVESSQSMIRIVGLSATLPNYIDVARFLRVSPHKGLFFFDSRFRPVPLSTSFIGVKAIKQFQQMTDMDQVCYDKVYEMVQKGHQVMVFVHARNATVRTAMVLKETALQRNQLKTFEAPQGSQVGLAIKAMARSRNKQMGELFPCGFSIHHAGMLRSDRSLVEKYFSDGLIKVLVCTSTLAWGVNLPAHAVIIRGTEIYDSKHGSFIDLGILDVLQIFGRAGRPQFDKSGHGTIITSHDKLSHYLSLLTNQFPIESNFINCLVDNLNAEISLGTISNVNEAVEWLSYTYLFVRMRINPQVYGFNYQDVVDDPMLYKKRHELIHVAATYLDKAHMIRYNKRTGDLSVTDLGRTASHFYVKYNTVEVFNELMHPIMNETEILSMVSQSQEFEQLKVRDDELDELDQLMHEHCEVQVAGGSENLHGKVNILLQTFLSLVRVNAFSLISDLAYITQNAVRICRALFDIVLRKNNPIMAGRFLMLSKMFEQQQWDIQSPMRQFHNLGPDILQKIEERKLSVDKLRDMDAREIGVFLRHEKMGQLVKKCAAEFPLLEINATLQPITRTVLRIRLQIGANFQWNDRVHGKTSETFYIWVEDPDNNYMYHSEYFLITRKQVMTGEVQDLIMTIPLTEPLPPQYYVRAISDRWLGSMTVCPLSFQHLILPDSHPPHTDLLELQPLPITALQDAKLEMLYNFTHFNPIQTQIFHCLFHTDNNVLLGAPTGSGKTIAAEIAMFRVFKKYPHAKVVYIAPMKALVRERMKDWKVRLEGKLNRKVVELTGDVTPDVRAIAAADVIVTTPEKWDGISRSWQTRNYVRDVALIVIDEIHLLGEDRGPVLEVIVSRTNYIASHTSKTLRIVGLSTALANAKDLANWLNIGEMGLYNFRPSVRPVPLEVHINGFPGKHYCPRMATMNRPTFQAIRQHSPAQPTLIFVSSRRQTRLTALDLIAYLAAEDNPKQWLHLPEDEMEILVGGVKDNNLKLTLAFGIGIHHAGLQERDRQTVEELFVNQKIQVLVATATLAWGVNFPAHLVVVKGTEFYDGKTHRYVDMPITDVLQMMGRAGRPQFDDHGVAVILVHDVKKNFYKKFLYEPFPVESSLLQVMPDHFNAEIVSGTIQTKQDVLDYLTWTYFFRRLLQNPSYYELDTIESKDVNVFLSGLVEKALNKLREAYCIEIEDDDRTVHATSMGRIASYYYLSHQTMLVFQEELKRDLTNEQVLKLLSDVHEYAELPVRHNEDGMNADLAKLCPSAVDPLSYDSPHTKAHLLLQAHFSRLQLPNSDYLTDLKSVMDQTIRILQAMIDVCAERGWLATTLRVQQLMQMVIQGRWITDSPLLTLPNITQQCIHLLERSVFKDASHKGKVTTLPSMRAYFYNRYSAFANVLCAELTEVQIEQAHRVLCDMPVLNVDVAIRGCSGLETEGEKRFTQPPGRTQWVEVHAEQDYTLLVRMSRLNRSREFRAHCPRFPKGKDEGWFLTLGSIESGELLALKRVAGVRGNTSSQQLSFRTPKKIGRMILTLYVMSDCYLGWDQQYNLQLDVLPSTAALRPPPIAASSDFDEELEVVPMEGDRVW